MNKIHPPAPSRRLRRAALSLFFALSIMACGLAPTADAAGRQQRRAGSARGRRPAAAAKVKGAKARGARAAKSQAAPLVEPTAGEESFEDGEMRRERAEWHLSQLTYPSGELPPAARLNAWESRPRKSLKELGDVMLPSADALRWEPLGPAPTQSGIPSWGLTSGRLNAIAFHPTDPKVVLVGASTGGVWRSSDGGETFTPASDSQVDVAVGAIAFARSNTRTVYAAMGDNDNGYFGTGVLKSTDGGRTWAQVARLHNAPGANCPQPFSPGCLPSLGRSTSIAVDPTNPNKVFLAHYVYYDGNINGSLFSSGLFYSEDGGVNWTKSLAGLVREVVFHPTNTQVIYAGLNRKDPDANPTGPAGVWKSVDGGKTWAIAYAAAAAPAGDMRLAVTPAAPESVYVYTNAGGLRVEVSTNGGQSWTNMGAAGVDPGQFGYNTYLAVSPANPQVIYVGARDVFKSSDGGQTYTNLTNNFHAPSWNYNPTGAKAHPDQQAFSFVPGQPDSILIGNDGGLYKSSNGGVSFRSLNTSLGLTQFVGITAHATDPNVTYGGAQDNGSQVRTGTAASTRWREFITGDGGRAVVIPTAPSVVFSTYIRTTIFRWGNNGGSFQGEVGDRDSAVVFKDSSKNPSDTTYKDRVAFYPPFVGNGTDGAIYFGTHRLWYSTDLGANWTVPGGPSIDQTKGGSDTLSAIGVQRSAYSASQTIYTGSSQGRVMVSTDGGATWNDRMIGLPNRFVESITVDRNDPTGATAYLTVGGFATGHVFKTINHGLAWVDISGVAGANGLPNSPVNALLVDPANPSVIYAGTDIGVYRSTSNGLVWEGFNNGLPPTVVTSFTVTANGKIQLSTYGRGVYQLGETETATLQFDQTSYAASEAEGGAYLLLRRAGNMGATVSVNVRTVDNPASVRCDNTTTAPNVAFARCDYSTTVDTITFGPHEFVKSIRIPVVDDAHVEPNEDVSVVLSNPSAGAALGTAQTATLRITSDDGVNAVNPFDTHAFFVRQHYLDFLSREPEQSGFDAWKRVLDNCSQPFNHDPLSPAALCDRNTVSMGFFRSREFELKGLYVFRFYRSSYGRLPAYAEIIPDMRLVTGADGPDLFQKKAAFAEAWAQRQEFQTAYGGKTNAEFVTLLLGRYGQPAGLQQIRTPDPAQPDAEARITLTRSQLIGGLDAGTLTRAQVLRAVADSDEVSGAEFQTAFVAMQYYGYLRRTPDQTGFNSWMLYLQTHPEDYYTMVNGFVYSQEYRLRFGKE